MHFPVRLDVSAPNCTEYMRIFVSKILQRIFRIESGRYMLFTYNILPPSFDVKTR